MYKLRLSFTTRMRLRSIFVLPSLKIQNLQKRLQKQFISYVAVVGDDKKSSWYILSVVLLVTYLSYYVIYYGQRDIIHKNDLRKELNLTNMGRKCSILDSNKVYKDIDLFMDYNQDKNMKRIIENGNLFIIEKTDISSWSGMNDHRVKLA